MKELILLKKTMVKKNESFVIIVNQGFEFQDSVNNSCHDLIKLSVNINDIENSLFFDFFV